MSELSLPQLCQLRNYPAIAKACEQRFGVPVNEQALAAQSERVMRSHKKGFGWCWGECTWFMFLKNRMCGLSGGAGGTAVTDGGAGGAGGTIEDGSPGAAPGGGGGGGPIGANSGAGGRGQITLTYTATYRTAISTSKRRRQRRG